MSIFSSRSNIVDWIPVLVTFFFGAIFAFPSVNFRSRHLLHVKLRSYMPRFLRNYLFMDFSLGEILALLLFLGFLAGRFTYQYNSFLTQGFRVLAPVFRALGEVNFVTLAFLILPVSKHSIWLPLLGISFERAYAFHKIWAIITITIMGIHGFGMWISFATTPDSGWPSYVFEFRENSHGWSNLSGFLSFIFMFLSFLMALPYMRRNFFELFYYTHIVCAPLVYVFAGLHMRQVLSWMYPTFALMGIDWAIRFYYNHFRPSRILSMRSIQLSNENTRVVELKLAAPIGTIAYEAGQFFILKFPVISFFEHHPFSTSIPMCICNNNMESVVTFHIKVQGKDTWTNKLAQLCSNNSNDNTENSSLPSSCLFYLDGPYGKPYIPMHLYHHLIFICGGIGVTPCINILQDIINFKINHNAETVAPSMKNKLKSVNDLRRNSVAKHELLYAKNKSDWSNVRSILFVWSCRDNILFEEFKLVLQQAVTVFGQNNILLHNTSKTTNPMTFMVADDGRDNIKLDILSVNSNIETGTNRFDANKNFNIHSVNDQLKIHTGHRPDYSKLMNEFISNCVKAEQDKYGCVTSVNKKFGVFGCGPTTMLEQVRDAVDEQRKDTHNEFTVDIHLHTEVFEF